MDGVNKGIGPEYLLERIIQNDVIDAVQTNRLNQINGSMDRAARATEDLTLRTTALEIATATRHEESKGEFKATRKELRLYALALGVATVGSRFLTNGPSTGSAVHAALRLVGLA